MINRKIIEIPYRVIKFFRFDAKEYNIGDMFTFIPSSTRYRNLLKIDVIERLKPEECVFRPSHNNFLFNGVIYQNNEIIPSEQIVGYEKLIDQGFIKQALLSEEENKFKNIKYFELAKKLGIETKVLFEKLREDEEIDKILGDKPSHLSFVDSKINEKLDEIFKETKEESETEKEFEDMSFDKDPDNDTPLIFSTEDLDEFDNDVEFEEEMKERLFLEAELIEDCSKQSDNPELEE